MHRYPLHSLCMFPQVGGSSALQRSRVGSLLPISTPTVAHGMTWSWAPLKLGKVSQFRLSCLCPPTHTRAHTHTQTQPHTLCYIPTYRYHLCPQSSVFDLWQNGANPPLLHHCRPTLTPAPVSTPLCVCLPLQAHLNRVLIQAWVNSKEECQERPDHNHWSDVLYSNALYSRDAVQYLVVWIPWSELMKEACVSISSKK